MHENPTYTEVNDQRYPQTVGRITLPAHHGMLADPVQVEQDIHNQVLEEAELKKASEIAAAGKEYWDAVMAGAMEMMSGDGMLSDPDKQPDDKLIALAQQQAETNKAQADANAKILDKVFENGDIGSGVTLFAFSDEWWKAGNNKVQDIGGWAPNSTGVPYDGTPNEEYWGIVDIDRNKKQTFEIIKQKYNSLQNN